MIYTISSSTRQLSGQIRLSASKSESNRALIINALSGDQLNLDNLSDARDTQTMQGLLKADDAIWDVLDAGTTMRFCTAFLAIRGKDQIITGTPRMKERPIGLLVEALREIGADITYLEKEGYPPLRISRIEPQTKPQIAIPGNVSSQYISALLMIAPTLPMGLEIDLIGEVFSKPYIQMTLSLMARFGVGHRWDGNRITIAPQPYQPGRYTIESDWSGASYWYALIALSKQGTIHLKGLRKESNQGDQAIVDIMAKMGVETRYEEDGVVLHQKGFVPDHQEINFRTCPDLAQTVLVAAAVLGVRLTMTGLESLKIKETDRILAMQNELTKLNAELVEHTGSWSLIPGELPNEIAAIETYEDHRMAMAFAPVGLIRPVQIHDPEVVKKSYPGYWEHLKSVGIKVRP